MSGLDERERMGLLALFVATITIVFFAVMDSVMVVYVFDPTESSGIGYYWKLLPFLVAVVAVMAAAGSLLGDYGNWSGEDYVGAFLLILTPLLLGFFGILDIASASMIEQLRGNGFLTWTLGNHPYDSWWWLGPDQTIIPLAPWIIATLFERINPNSFDLILSSIMGSVVLLVIWVVYVKS